MITRASANLQIVGAIPTLPNTTDGFHDWAKTGGTCTCAGVVSTGTFPNSTGFAGYIIDRLGLSQNFNSVAIGVQARANYSPISSADSTAHFTYYGLGIGLQHSSSTCSGGFTDYSTADWKVDQPFVVVTTATSTASAFYTVEGAGVADSIASVLTTALTSATSTGNALFIGGPAPVFNIAPAKRFIRAVIGPHIETSGCGQASMFVQGGVMVFGDPDKGPADSTIRGRVHVTSACST